MPSKRYAFCFVFNEDGKVLVLKRADFMRARPGDWDLPGGTIEENETDVQGVVRELFEETGLMADRPELLTSKGGPWNGVNYTFSYFRIDAKAGQITLSKEHTEYEWHHPLVAAAMVDFTPHRIAIGSLIEI